MDAFDWTPEMALEHALKFVRQNETDAVIVICLSKGEDGREYNTKFAQSGLCLSEIVALLEIQKARLMADLANDSQTNEDDPFNLDNE